MNKKIFEEFEWLNKPKESQVNLDNLIITTEPDTDLWQRTYYGFQNNNAPAFLKEVGGDFSFVVKACFEDAKHFSDQCGVFMYIDNENWVKISVENENKQFSRLGSVVTNLGYSDWATVDIPVYVSEMWYRISRRGQNFYIENSNDGEVFEQMRMFHMHKLSDNVKVGVYACSPLKSSFNAVFSNIHIGSCEWAAYIPPQ
jgi:hypothetical protein